MIKGIKHALMIKSREKKYQQFLSLTKPSNEARLLDVGVADQEYSPVDNYLEKKYPYSHNITALSISTLEEFRKRYPQVETVSYQGGKFPFRDKEFDIIFSNAVIEHVGSFQQQLLFLKEIGRVGYQFFFTTPAREFPIEMHTNYPFIHWFSKKKFNMIVSLLGKEWASGDYMNLLKKKNIENLLRSANIITFKILIHKMGPFPLHYTVWGRSEH